MAQPLRLADRIDTEARKLRFSRIVLAIITAPLYWLSWVVSKSVRFIGRLLAGIWLLLAWVLTAIKVGWQDARH